MTKKTDLRAGEGARKLAASVGNKPPIWADLEWKTVRIDIFTPCTQCDGTGRLENPACIAARYAQDHGLEYSAAHLGEKHVSCPQCEAGTLKERVLLSDLVKYMQEEMKRDTSALRCGMTQP